MKLQPISKIDVFDLKVNQPVYTKSGIIIGKVAEIKETAYEVVDAFLSVDDTNANGLVKVTLATNDYYVEVK